MNVHDELVLAVNSVLLALLAHLILWIVNKGAVVCVTQKAPIGPAGVVHFLTPVLCNMSTTNLPGQMQGTLGK